MFFKKTMHKFIIFFLDDLIRDSECHPREWLMFLIYEKSKSINVLENDGSFLIVNIRVRNYFLKFHHGYYLRKFKKYISILNREDKENPNNCLTDAEIEAIKDSMDEEIKAQLNAAADEER